MATGFLKDLRVRRRSIFGATLAAAILPHTSFALDAGETSDSLEVPIDHTRSGEGTFSLGYGLLSPFDPRRRTVFVIADGQQFYVAPGRLERSLGPIFDDAFNVVGIFGRADAPEVQARIGSGDETDWAEAYRLLQASQWLDDIEHLRRRLVGSDGPIGLYGRSGGGLLAHQFVARHGASVDKIYTQAAVNPYLEAHLGLSSDRFWEEIGEGDRRSLSTVLASGRYEPDAVALLFQRQNFFVPREQLGEARSELIAVLATADDAAIAEYQADYQIDAIAALRATPRGPAMHVRLFEFYAPFAAQVARNESGFHPDKSVLELFARPFMPLLRNGAIEPPSFDARGLSASKAHACIVAGRWDHTCEYRSQIALAAAYPSSKLFLLDDDHVFHRLAESGVIPLLVRGAFEGLDSENFAAASKRLDPLLWRGA